MFTRISTKAAAAALLLAPLAAPTPLAADMSLSTQAVPGQFRGGGHIGDFVNCPGWDTLSFPVTARVTLLEDDQWINIFAPNFSVGWHDFDDPDGNGWERVMQTGVFGSTVRNEAEIRVLNITPPNADSESERFNLRFLVSGFASGDPSCRASVRLTLRAQH